MTSIATHIARYEASERAHEAFDVDFPGWEVRELAVEDRPFVSESDVRVEDIDDGPVSDADWQAFLEMSWVDPAERA